MQESACNMQYAISNRRRVIHVPSPPGTTADGPGPLGGGGGGGPRRCGRPPPGPSAPSPTVQNPPAWPSTPSQPTSQQCGQPSSQTASQPASQPLRQPPSRTASQPPSPVRQQLDSQLAGHVACQPVSQAPEQHENPYSQFSTPRAN